MKKNQKTCDFCSGFAQHKKELAYLTSSKEKAILIKNSNVSNVQADIDAAKRLYVGKGGSGKHFISHLNATPKELPIDQDKQIYLRKDNNH